MENINIGDRVVCWDDSGNYSGLIKNREYIVYDVKQVCCEVAIDIGLYSHHPGQYCYKCNKLVTESFEKAWFRITRFRKVQEKKEVNYVKLEVNVEEPCLN